MPKKHKEKPLPSEEGIDVYFDELRYAITDGEPVMNDEGILEFKLMSDEAINFFKDWIDWIEEKNEGIRKNLKKTKRSTRDMLIAQLIGQTRQTTSSLEEAFAQISEMYITDKDGKRRYLGLGAEAIAKIYSKYHDLFNKDGYLIVKRHLTVKEDILQSLLSSTIDV